MILSIAKKEFQLNIMTFKFIVGTVLCIVLAAIFVPVLINDYQQRLTLYNENTRKNEAELRKVKCYRSIRPTIYRPPSVLAVFAGGIENQVADSASIELESVPYLQQVSNVSNPYLSIFPNLEISLIIKIVMGLLALLMSYDVISTERENGTLKLILSYSISRHQILLGKVLAGLLTLMVSLLSTLIVVILILLLHRAVDLNSEQWLRIGLMFLTSAIYITGIYNLGLVFSCASRRSSTSLMYAVLVWVIFIFIIPNVNKSVAACVLPLESRAKIDGQIGALKKKLNSELKSLNDVIFHGNLWGVPDSFGGWYYNLCDKNTLKYLNECFKYNETRKIAYADGVWDIRAHHLDRLIRQRDFAVHMSRLSPAQLYENIMFALAGTDSDTYSRYTALLRDYRASIIDYFKLKTDNFASTDYFTQGNTTEEWEQFFNKGPKFRKRHGENIPALELEDFPHFIYRPNGIRSNLNIVIVDILILLLVVLLFFVISFVSFLKYDVQ